MPVVSFCLSSDFNPRSPRGERPWTAQKLLTFLPISIHAPREGSDSAKDNNLLEAIQFQSTLPARGATVAIDTDREIVEISIHAPREGSDQLYSDVGTSKQCISIHAPREGSDLLSLQCLQVLFYFNPRSPRGERRIIYYISIIMPIFQSTLPARGATF